MNRSCPVGDGLFFIIQQTSFHSCVNRKINDILPVATRRHPSSSKSFWQRSDRLNVLDPLIIVQRPPLWSCSVAPLSLIKRVFRPVVSHNIILYFSVLFFCLIFRLFVSLFLRKDFLTLCTV